MPFARLQGRLFANVRPLDRYRPQRYWEDRATELIETYDHPETWAEKHWMSAGVEEAQVPPLLHASAVKTVLVVGSGSGRQYEYLEREGFRPAGFDISPSLVRVSRDRFPNIRTGHGNVVGAHRREAPADAVITSAVLQHVRPRDIERAVDSIKRLARRLVVVREVVELEVNVHYQFAHDYEQLFDDWRQVHRSTTDKWPGVRVELIAWEPKTHRDEDSRARGGEQHVDV